MTQTKDAIARFLAGDTSAFDVIYQENYKKAYATALYYAKNHQDAEDIVQEVFLEIYKSLAQLKDVDVFGAWMNRIVFTQFNRRIRRKSEKMKVDLGAEVAVEDLAVSDESLDPRIQSSNREIMKVIESSINELSRDYQVVARLRFYDEMSIEEIASLLAIPKGTVKSRINQLRKRMQTYLQENNVAPGKSLALIGPQLLFAFFQLHENNVTRNLSVPVWTPVAAASVPSKPRPRASLSAVAGVGALTVVLAGSVIVNHAINSQPGNVIDYDEVIARISYDTAYHSANLPVRITFDQPDHVAYVAVRHSGSALTLAQDQEGYEVIVTENGVYTVEIVDSKNRTTQKNFQISNIDSQPPTVESVELVDNQLLVIAVSDDLSGIAGDQVVLTLDGVAIVSQRDGSVYSFVIDPVQTYLLSVVDNVGNELRSEIKFTQQIGY